MIQDLRDYQSEIDRLEVGATARLNHIHCPAGTDTRQRLYLSRPHSDPTVVLAYCHNCQEGDIFRGSQWETYRTFAHKGDGGIPAVRQVITHQGPPENLVFRPENWPTQATAWRIDQRLSADQCQYHSIAYYPTHNRIYLPIFNRMMGNEGNLVGYQLRHLLGKGPKYLTSTPQDWQGYTILDPLGSDYQYTFIVEDFASGIHIRHAHPHNRVIVNYGTKINLEALNAACNGRPVIVWLDNDSDHVREQAQTMARTLKLMTNEPVLVEDQHTDPKKYDSKKINQCVVDLIMET